MSALVKAGLDVVVEDPAATNLLNKISTTIKAGGNSSKTLTATVQDTIGNLGSLSPTTADILNYIVTGDNATVTQINNLKRAGNTITATLKINSSAASTVDTRID